MVHGWFLIETPAQVFKLLPPAIRDDDARARAFLEERLQATRGYEMKK